MTLRTVEGMVVKSVTVVLFALNDWPMESSECVVAAGSSFFSSI